MFWQTGNDDLLASSAVENDTEALQTDIQRFVAILGFCLMAIFALVQSIPVTVEKQETIIEDLSRKMEAQLALLARLEEENQLQQQEIDNLQQWVQLAQIRENNLTRAQEILEQQAKRIVALQSAQNARQKNMVVLKNLLNKRDQQIRQLEIENKKVTLLLDQTRAALSEAEQIKAEKKRLERRLAQTEQNSAELEKLRREKTELTRLLQSSQQPSLQPSAETLTIKPEKQQKGSYVAFASDQVFMDLLEARKIDLYIQVEGLAKWFQVELKNSKLTFESKAADPHVDLWEVSESLVPTRIRSQFRTWTTLAKRSKIMMVGLPADISASLRRHPDANGRYLIQSGGNVVFTRFGE